MKTKICVAVSAFVLCLSAAAASAQQGYKKPPKEVLDILNAPTTPGISVSPSRDNVILSTTLRYPPLADLAQPVLRIAGRRINPATNSPFRFQYSVGLTLKRIADGSEIKIETPPGAKISGLEWSDNGKHFAFLNTTANRVEVWVGDAATGRSAGCPTIARSWSNSCPQNAAPYLRHRLFRPSQTRRRVPAGPDQCAPTKIY
jgi:hypothetical protein